MLVGHERARNPSSRDRVPRRPLPARAVSVWPAKCRLSYRARLVHYHYRYYSDDDDNQYGGRPRPVNIRFGFFRHLSLRFLKFTRFETDVRHVFGMKRRLLNMTSVPTRYCQYCTVAEGFQKTFVAILLPYTLTIRRIWLVICYDTLLSRNVSNR